MSYTTHLGMVFTTYGDFGDDLLLFYPHYYIIQIHSI
jgi:hypothetical protein